MSSDNGASTRAGWGVVDVLEVFARRHGYSVELLPSGEIPLGQTWTCSNKRRRLWVTPEITAADTSRAVAWMRRFSARGSDAPLWCLPPSEHPDTTLAS